MYLCVHYVFHIAFMMAFDYCLTNGCLLTCISFAVLNAEVYLSSILLLLVAVVTDN